MAHGENCGSACERSTRQKQQRHGVTTRLHGSPEAIEGSNASIVCVDQLKSVSVSRRVGAMLPSYLAQCVRDPRNSICDAETKPMMLFCNVRFFVNVTKASGNRVMRTTIRTLTILFLFCVAPAVNAESERVVNSTTSTQPALTDAAPELSVSPEVAAIDDREVYIVTSMIDGKVPKVGPARHASIAICPKGVPPVVYENGVAVSNWRHCKLYGTQVWERGFKRDGKRIDARATKICGISATTVERRMRCHRQMNVPLVHDCRHHVIQVLNLRTRHGRLKPACAIK